MNKTERFWDKQADTYNKSERQFETAFKRINKKTKKYLKPNDTVLDYGCATGLKTFEFVSDVKKIFGLDISSKMINKAKSKADELKIKNVDFKQGTIFDVEFKDNTFDAIIAYGILHLLDENQKVLKKIDELLKPGGYFISTTVCLKEKMSFKSRFHLSLYLLIKKIGLFPIYLNMLEYSEVDEIIKSGNFKILETEKVFHGFHIYFVVAQKK
jgi:ubiquinone/menaquinone biosynthesis C-methylase UbiE